MNNINITEEQERMLIRGGCSDCMLVTEHNDIRLIAMVDGDEDFMFINYEVANWPNDEINHRSCSYFNEDFDGAMEEFNRRVQEQQTTINDVLLFIASVIAFFILINF
tara:strand:+ start:105 stop:428 length:324 start_codon:yes stop_codon:yes gene_type:complete